MKTYIVITPQGVEVVVVRKGKDHIEFSALGHVSKGTLKIAHDWLENEGFFDLVAGRIPGCDLAFAARLIRSLKL